MKSIAGIVWLGLRTAVSSKLMLTMGILTVAVAVGMPLIVSGDGSPEGEFRIMQTYALGSVWLLLCVTTLWTASAFMAGEIEDRTLRMVMVRPIRSWQVWCGKWTSMLLLNAGLLTVSGLAIYAIGFHRIGRLLDPDSETGKTVRNDIGTAWQALPPAIADPEKEIFYLLAQWGERGLLPDDREGLQRARRAARREVLARRSTAAPGTSLDWTFPASAARRDLLRNPPPLRLRFSYTTSPFERGFVAGSWHVRVGDNPAVTIVTDGLYDGRHTLDLPAAIRTALLAGDDPLVVRFENADQDRSIPVMFHADAPVELLAPAGAYAGALLRTMLVMLGVTGALAALGLAAGSLFSSPVALFVSAAFLLAFAVSNSRLALDVDSVAPPTGTTSSLIHRIGAHLLTGVRTLSAPAFRVAPLQALAEGTAPSRPDLARSLAMLLVCYPFLFGLLGSSVLARRQLAV